MPFFNYLNHRRKKRPILIMHAVGAEAVSANYKLKSSPGELKREGGRSLFTAAPLNMS
ncbi:MAG: hypothetical protein QOE77_495 [Blastocatellia bacterium]|nr:hypothetical protein [Blastocatellia bacterium]